MTGDITGGTNIYYTPFHGEFVPLWNGTTWVMNDTGGELVQALNDTTKSPTAAVANAIYDMFVWNDSGVIRCTRGPAWLNQTTRALQLQKVQGYLTNSASITNGPVINYGVFVGTIMTDNNALVTFLQGGQTPGSLQALISLWNMYNRIDWCGMISDTTTTWTYSTSAWRPVNNNPNVRATYVCGLAEDPVVAAYEDLVYNTATGTVPVTGYIGIGIDSTTVPSGLRGMSGNANSAALGIFANALANYNQIPGLGVHFIQALENANAAQQVTFYGS
jgi:hypothetical protein